MGERLRGLIKQAHIAGLRQILFGHGVGLPGERSFLRPLRGRRILSWYHPSRYNLMDFKVSDYLEMQASRHRNENSSSALEDFESIVARLLNANHSPETTSPENTDSSLKFHSEDDSTSPSKSDTRENNYIQPDALCKVREYLCLVTEEQFNSVPAIQDLHSLYCLVSGQSCLTFKPLDIIFKPVMGMFGDAFSPLSRYDTEMGNGECVTKTGVYPHREDDPVVRPVKHTSPVIIPRFDGIDTDIFSMLLSVKSHTTGRDFIRFMDHLETLPSPESVRNDVLRKCYVLNIRLPFLSSVKPQVTPLWHDTGRDANMSRGVQGINLLEKSHSSDTFDSYGDDDYITKETSRPVGADVRRTNDVRDQSELAERVPEVSYSRSTNIGLGSFSSKHTARMSTNWRMKDEMNKLEAIDRLKLLEASPRTVQNNLESTADKATSGYLQRRHRFVNPLYRRRRLKWLERLVGLRVKEKERMIHMYYAQHPDDMELYPHNKGPPTIRYPSPFH